jgi:hypothetical protein
MAVGRAKRNRRAHVTSGYYFGERISAILNMVASPSAWRRPTSFPRSAAILADYVGRQNDRAQMGRLVQQPPPVWPHRPHPDGRGRSQLLCCQTGSRYDRVTQTKQPPKTPRRVKSKICPISRIIYRPDDRQSMFNVDIQNLVPTGRPELINILKHGKIILFILAIEC